MRVAWWGRPKRCCAYAKDLLRRRRGCSPGPAPLWRGVARPSPAPAFASPPAIASSPAFAGPRPSPAPVHCRPPSIAGPPGHPGGGRIIREGHRPENGSPADSASGIIAGGIDGPPCPHPAPRPRQWSRGCSHAHFTVSIHGCVSPRMTCVRSDEIRAEAACYTARGTGRIPRGARATSPEGCGWPGRERSVRRSARFWSGRAPGRAGSWPAWPGRWTSGAWPPCPGRGGNCPRECRCCNEAATAEIITPGTATMTIKAAMMINASIK